MSTIEQLEERIAALENTVADLLRQLEVHGTSTNWVEKIPGVTDPVAFEEMMEYARAFRRGELPGEESGV